jgi:hypothetical protein
MVPSQLGPTFVSIAPRFVVPDVVRALAFYERLGFHTANYDSIAIIERDGMEIHINHDPDLPPQGSHTVCYITVRGIEALYQRYRALGVIQGTLSTTEYGMREFVVCDPFNNLLIFGEPIAAPESDAQAQG